MCVCVREQVRDSSNKGTDTDTSFQHTTDIKCEWVVILSGPLMDAVRSGGFEQLQRSATRKGMSCVALGAR